MHIIHNATNDLEKVTEGYSDMLHKLSLLCKLISNKEMKQVLLANCFPEGDVPAFYQEIAEVSHTVHEKRWNTVATAVEIVSALEVALENWVGCAELSSRGQSSYVQG